MTIAKAIARPYIQSISLSDHPQFLRGEVKAVSTKSGLYLSNPTVEQATESPHWQSCQGWFFWQLTSDGSNPSVEQMKKAHSQYAKFWEWVAKNDFKLPIDPLFPEVLQEASRAYFQVPCSAVWKWEFPYKSNCIVSSFRFSLFGEKEHDIGYHCWSDSSEDGIDSMRQTHTVRKDGSAYKLISRNGREEFRQEYPIGGWGVEQSHGSFGSRGGWWIVEK